MGLESGLTFKYSHSEETYARVTKLSKGFSWSKFAHERKLFCSPILTRGVVCLQDEAVEAMTLGVLISVDHGFCPLRDIQVLRVTKL